MLSIAFSFHSAFFPLFCGPRPSAPVSAVGASLRAGRYRVRHFFFTVNTQLRFNPHLISTSPDLLTSAPPPSPQPSSRGIVGRRLRQLRCCVADFPHSASLLLQFCGVVRVSLSIVGWPSVRLTPFLRAGRSVRGFGSRRGQPRLALISTLSITHSSHLLPFFTSLWPAAFRGSLALTPAGRYPLRPILFGLARRLPLASKVRPARRADVILLFELVFSYLVRRRTGFCGLDSYSVVCI